MQIFVEHHKELLSSSENRKLLSFSLAAGIERRREMERQLFNNKRINKFLSFRSYGISLCSIDFLFNNKTLFSNNEKNEEKKEGKKVCI